ncbi:MAG: CinA family nicotinamide mononucleotide deamidase-related protein [Chloroflexota bacterium]
MSNTNIAVEIVTTGTEILLGEIVDTNAAWIAQQLRDAGVNLYYKTTVGDNRERIHSILSLGLGRSDVLLVTGGLGPTVDDVTRDVIADATGCPLYLDEKALVDLKAKFQRFGVEMTDNNLQQVYIPEGAIVVDNPVGTAPGFIVEPKDDSIRGTVIAMPGVPREMKRMMTDTILPYLRKRNGNIGIIRRRVLRTIGIGESTLDDKIGDLMESSNPTVGLAAHTGQVDVRVTARAETESEAEAMIDQLAQTIRERVGDVIYSTTPKESYGTVIARGLQAKEATVAILETNTAGTVAERLKAGLESYDAVAGQWQTSDELPTELVAHIGNDSVSEANAGEAAQALVALSCATYGLAILGTSGVDEGFYGNNRGETWIALATADGVIDTQHVNFSGGDEFTKVRMGNTALGVLWREI